MGEHTFTVEEVAKKLNVTPRTLHYYEEMGLISPASRTVGGHRLYDDQVVAKLFRILQIKDSLGTSLQEIREIMSSEDAMERLKESYQEISNEHEKQFIIEEYSAHLVRIIEKIDKKIANLSEMKKTFTDRLHRVIEIKNDNRS